MLADNDEIAAWTNTRNAPVAMYQDELPRSSWLDILCSPNASATARR
jgi:hypothetical protein